MTTCAICGRPLTSPASIAAGVGPVCGARKYSRRIFSRHGGGNMGWDGIDSWARANNPCFKCKHFRFPDAKQERRVSVTSIEVAMDGKVERFSADSIGGCCTRHDRLVDGNTINDQTSCGGMDHESRPDNNAASGVLHTPKGDLSVGFLPIF